MDMEGASSVAALRSHRFPCAADTLLSCHSKSNQAANPPWGSPMIDSRRAVELAVDEQIAGTQAFPSLCSTSSGAAAPGLWHKPSQPTELPLTAC